MWNGKHPASRAVRWGYCSLPSFRGGLKTGPCTSHTVCEGSAVAVSASCRTYLLTAKKISAHIRYQHRDVDRVRRCEPLLPCGLPMFFCFLFFGLTFAFQLLDKLWYQVSSLFPPGTRLQFLSCIGCSIPTARRFTLNVANSLPFFYKYALGGTRTLQIEL